MEEVEHFQAVEIFGKLGDLAGINRPHIFSKSIGNNSPVNEDNGRDAGEQGDKYAVVVSS